MDKWGREFRKEKKVGANLKIRRDMGKNWNKEKKKEKGYDEEEEQCFLRIRNSP